MSHMVSYDSTLIDNYGDRTNSAMALFCPNDELLSSPEAVAASRFLLNDTLCNFDLCKVSETSKSCPLRNVQRHHLDQMKHNCCHVCKQQPMKRKHYSTLNYLSALRVTILLQMVFLWMHKML